MLSVKALLTVMSHKMSMQFRPAKLASVFSHVCKLYQDLLHNHGTLFSQLYLIHSYRSIHKHIHLKYIFLEFCFFVLELYFFLLLFTHIYFDSSIKMEAACKHKYLPKTFLWKSTKSYPPFQHTTCLSILKYMG